MSVCVFLACTPSHSRTPPILSRLAGQMGTERTDVSVFETAYEILYIYDVVLRNPRL